MALSSRDPVDNTIMDALSAGSADNWEALEVAAHSLAGENTFATWFGGSLVEAASGESGGVRQMPYPVYSEPVQEVLRCLGALGLMVPFDWVNWELLPRYRDHPSELESAPVSDSVRVLIAVRRSERFVDGSLEGALTSGLIQTAVARLIRWYTEERTESR